MKRYRFALGAFWIGAAVWGAASVAGTMEAGRVTWQRYEWRASTFVPSAQEQVALDVDAQGRMITVWSSRRQHDGRAGVFAQRFDADGVALGTETALALWDGGHQSEPAVVADVRGGTWMAWQSFGQNGYAGTIIARHFDADFRGGPEIAVSGRTRVHETQPALATWDDGRAVLVWTTRTGPQDPLKIYGRLLAADGQFDGPEFAVGAAGDASESTAAVATQSDGSFAVAYNVVLDGLPAGIRFQRFDSHAAPSGAALRLGGDGNCGQVEPVVASHLDGYIVAWHDPELDGDDYGVVAQRFNRAGQALCEPFVVNSTRTGPQNGAAIAVADDGHFAIAWNSSDGDRSGIFAQLFNVDGTRRGGEFRLNEQTKGVQALRAACASRRLAFGARGALLCAWSGDAGLGDKNGAHVTMFAPRPLDLAGRQQGVTDDMPVAAGTAEPTDMATPHIPPTYNPLTIDTGERDFRNDRSGFGFTAVPGTGWTPPDPTMGVGPAHIVVMTNGAIAFFQKDGTRDFQQDISGSAGFWGSVGATSFIFDPEVHYDPLSGRFFAMASEGRAPPNQSKSYVLLAVSDDSNPNGTWYKYRFETTAFAGNTFDSPNLGVDANVVYVTGDGFPNSGATYPVYTFDKASLLAGQPPAIQRSVLLTTSTQSAGIPPVAFDNPPAYYMCEHSEANPATTVRLIALRDPLGTPNFTTYTLTVPSYTPPENPPQQGTTIRPEMFDARFWSVAYRNGSLWGTHHVNSSRVRARWYEFKMNGWPTSGQNPTLGQWGEIDPGGTVRTFFTSITADPAGDAAICCARSSPTEYISMITTFRLPGDAAGTFRTPSTEVVSTGPDTSGRWGDYSAVEPDPANPSWLWAHHEYGSSSSWRTWVARMQLPPRTGDMNCDGAVNFDDINPFVLALSDPAGYAAAYPSCNILNGDINGDGLVNFDDINPFVALLTGP